MNPLTRRNQRSRGLIASGEEQCPIIASDSLIYFSYQQAGVTQDSDIWKVEKKDGVIITSTRSDMGMAGHSQAARVPTAHTITISCGSTKTLFQC